jgi:hypothetical protein
VSGLTATRTILSTELRAYWHRLFKSSPVRLVVLGVALLLAVVFLGGSLFGVGVAAGHFLPSALDSFLVGGFTVLSVVMLLLGFPTVISTLFVGRDLLMLVLAPVRTTEIFAARVVFAMSANLLISAILLSFILGAGVGAGASPLYFLLAPVMIVGQVLVVTAAQSILMSVVLRWVPARLARDVAAGVAALTGAAFYLTWNLTIRSSFSRTSRPDVASLTPLTQRVDWFPSAWPGHALSAIAAGNLGAGLGWAVAVLAIAGLVATAAALLYERTLLAGLGVFGTTPYVWRRTQRRAAPSPAAGRAKVARGAGNPLMAIVRKDWLAYRRDIRRLSRLLPALLFLVGYAVALSRPSSQFPGGFWADVLLISFLSLFMSNVVANPSIPSEHRGFQILRMAPLTMWQVLWAKVLATFPPVAGLLAVLAVVIGVVGHSRAADLIELIAFVVWLAFGFVAISVSAGGIDPKFDATDDRRAVGVAGALAGLAASAGFAVLSIGALALFVFGAAAAQGASGLGPIPATPLVGAAMLAGGVAVAAGAIALVWSLMWTANTRLNAFEEAITTT